MYTKLSLLQFSEHDDWFASQSNESASILRPSFADVFLLVIGATCQQGSSATPRSLTARIAMVIIFIAMMFLFVSYSANIVALLQSPSSKIQTLEDLYNSRLEVGAEDTSYNKYLFAVSVLNSKIKIHGGAKYCFTCVVVKRFELNFNYKDNTFFLVIKDF